MSAGPERTPQVVVVLQDTAALNAGGVVACVDGELAGIPVQATLTYLGVTFRLMPEQGQGPVRWLALSFADLFDAVRGVLSEEGADPVFSSEEGHEPRLPH